MPTSLQIQVFGERVSVELPMDLSKRFMPEHSSLCVIHPEKIPELLQATISYRNRTVAQESDQNDKENALVDDFMSMIHAARKSNAALRCVPFS